MGFFPVNQSAISNNQPNLITTAFLSYVLKLFNKQLYRHMQRDNVILEQFLKTSPQKHAIRPEIYALNAIRICLAEDL